ncbi:AAA family ATPase, partial [Pseudomonas sp. FSL R10-0071]|uniref:AAA family ATPase n=1 Tax=Pseudomonas sp. FSL R10-0071 TaxID=2662193 RepID=UPI003531BFA0
MNESTEQCPLCQQKLPEDFYRHLRKVFDTTYEERIRVLESLRGQYTHSAVGLISQIDSSTYPNAKLTQLTSELKAVLIENIRLIEDKLRTPSIAVTLVSSTDLIVQINELISVEQVGIDTFNAKLRDKSRHLELITNRFWVRFRSACDELLKESQQEITNYKV